MKTLKVKSAHFIFTFSLQITSHNQRSSFITQTFTETSTLSTHKVKINVIIKNINEHKHKKTKSIACMIMVSNNTNAQSCSTIPENPFPREDKPTHEQHLEQFLI